MKSYFLLKNTRFFSFTSGLIILLIHGMYSDALRSLLLLLLLLLNLVAMILIPFSWNSWIHKWVKKENKLFAWNKNHNEPALSDVEILIFDYEMFCSAKMHWTMVSYGRGVSIDKENRDQVHSWENYIIWQHWLK